MLKAVAQELSVKVQESVETINLVNKTKEHIKEKMQEKLSDQVLDINIRRMRAQIVKREEFESRKEKAMDKKRQEQYRLRMEFDEEKNMLTYDYKGNRMIVTQPREETFPGLWCPRMSVQGGLQRDSALSINEDSMFLRESAKEKKLLRGRNSIQNVDTLIKSMLEYKALESSKVLNPLQRKATGSEKLAEVELTHAKRASKRQINPQQIIQIGSFDLKDNMRASHGVSFR